MKRQPAPEPPAGRDPGYPSIASREADRRAFLKACLRSVLVAGVCTLPGGNALAQEDPPPPPPGVPPPEDWPEEHVRLVSEEPVEVTFRDDARARLVIAFVRGDGEEPEVDREELRRVVRETCSGFDRSVLEEREARATLEAALRARLDDVLKAADSSVDAVSVLPVPDEHAGETPEQEPEPPPPPGESPPPSAPGSAPAPEDAGPAHLPRPSGCLIHGEDCPNR